MKRNISPAIVAALLMTAAPMLGAQSLSADNLNGRPRSTSASATRQISNPGDTKCGTQAVLAALGRGIVFGRPPQGPKFVISPHFIVHFDTAGRNRIARAYAESTSVYAEYAWAVQIDTLGWAPPPPDGNIGGDSTYDIYVRDTNYYGLTTPEDDYANPYPDGATSFIIIDTGMSWDYLRGTVAHEFSHASQFRYSWRDVGWWGENTSTWMEDVCYDLLDDYFLYLNKDTSALKKPELPITDTTGTYEYSGGIWAMFLAEYYNINCPRRCWELMGRKAGENRLTGIDSTLREFYLSDLASALEKYAVWRYFAGPGRGDGLYHFSESGNWPASRVLRTHNTYPATGDQGSCPLSGPGGTSFVEFDSATEVLNLSFNGQDGYNWSAFAVGARQLSPSVERKVGLDHHGDGTTHLPTPHSRRCVLVPVVTQWLDSARSLNFTYMADTQAVGLDWVRRYGGQGTLPDYPKAMTIDRRENICVTGTIDHDGFRTLVADYGTIKYDTAGNEYWARVYDGPGHKMDFGLAIATDSLGNVYVTGGSDGEAVDTNYDYATVKYNSIGDELWVRRYATPGMKYEHAWGIAVDSSGNVYVTGWSGNSLPSIDDYLTVKYNAAGAEQWARRYNGPATYPIDDAYALALDRFGNVFVTGKSAGTDNNHDYATVKYDPEGNERWVRRYGCSPAGYDGALALVTDEQGNVYVSGESDSTQTRLKDIVTIKYDSAGNEQWRRRYPGPLYSGPYGYRYLTTAIDPRGNIYVAGNNSNGFVTIKYSSDGVERWARTYNGPGGQLATGIALDVQGNVYVAGYGPGLPPNYYDDCALVKYDSTGTLQWVGRYNGPADDDDFATSTAVSRSGRVYLTGYSYIPQTYEYATVRFITPTNQPLISPKPRNFSLILHQSQIKDTTLQISNEGYSYLHWSLRENPDAAWVSENPTTDSVHPSSWTDVAVRFNTTGLAPGTYHTNFVVANDDPDNPELKVSVEIQVLSGIGVSEESARPAAPVAFLLQDNLPNPFSSQTAVRYAVPKPCHVELGVYDCAGMLVRMLHTGTANAGYHRAVWDGSDEHGRQVAKGVYFCRLQSGSFTATKKMSKIE